VPHARNSRVRHRAETSGFDAGIGIVGDRPGTLIEQRYRSNQITAARFRSAVPAGPKVFIRSPITAPIAASQNCTMIMLQAIANSQGVESVRNGTALAITKATLRAQVYSAVLRTSFAGLKAAATENPRLITALTVVISAQKRNGMFIQDAYGADARLLA
jgi:hypothetical protein